MKNALISVSDKTGIVDFAKNLVKLNFNIISTGGTFKILQESGISNLVEISDFTNFPEGLNGRIKTLTPQVFGGILNLRDNDEHQNFCKKNNIENIDLVVVNLYPFKKNYDDPNKTAEQKIEQIDIGGPSMIRAAAKNYQFCAPVVDPEDYDQIIQQYKKNENLDINFRKKLACKVFELTAHYDLLIAKFWSENAEKIPLRYGENPHQKAVCLYDPFYEGPRLVGSEILNGKSMSFNNFMDANAALELILSFDQPFTTIIKHMTPCCAAVNENIENAFEDALEKGDKTSAFGGVIAVNRKVTKILAQKIVSFFNEIILAPDFDVDALEILKTKKNLRVIKISKFFDKKKSPNQSSDLVIKKIRGGTLIQDLDTKKITEKDLKIVTKKNPNKSEIQDLLIAWKIVKIVKSNAIVIVKNGALIGKGGGQTSRVEAMKIALKEAADKTQGAVIASDAFFPFPDSVEIAGKNKITSIIQPGGSVKDPEVIAKADEMGISMVLCETRSFLH